jgi:hypothetical protein
VLSVLLSQDRFGPLASTAAANERQNESDMAIRSVLLHNIVQRDLFVSVVTLKRRLVQIAYQENVRAAPIPSFRPPLADELLRISKLLRGEFCRCAIAGVDQSVIGAFVRRGSVRDGETEPQICPDIILAVPQAVRSRMPQERIGHPPSRSPALRPHESKNSPARHVGACQVTPDHFLYCHALSQTENSNHEMKD